MLEELGVPYERDDYGRQFENTATPEYKALNPTSKVPTLVDGDTAIWESNTILRYRAASAAALNGATPAEKTVGRALDGLPRASSIPPMWPFQGRQKDVRRSRGPIRKPVKYLFAQLSRSSTATSAGRLDFALGSSPSPTSRWPIS